MITDNFSRLRVDLAGSAAEYRVQASGDFTLTIPIRVIVGFAAFFVLTTIAALLGFATILIVFERLLTT